MLLAAGVTLSGDGLNICFFQAVTHSQLHPPPPLESPQWKYNPCRPDEPSLWGAGVPGAWGKLLCTFFGSIERAPQYHLIKTTSDVEAKCCSPKQHLRRPEPRNSSELRGECLRCLPIRCGFYLVILGKRPALKKVHRSFPHAPGTPAPHKRPPCSSPSAAKKTFPMQQTMVYDTLICMNGI